MNGGVEVASAYVTLMPSMRGFQGKLDKQLRGITAKSGADVGRKFGQDFASSAAKWAKRGALALGAAVSTALGASLKKGWDRLTAIEEAESKLTGLGHSAKSVETIMDSALASVKGTAYGLGDAATMAAGAVAAGIKPGKELTKYLKTAADAATIAGVSLNEMAPIFNRVQTQQRAYTMELNMLADRGIPIYQWLQDELGVTQAALRDMVSAGEIDSETYFKVIEENIGGAALESGKTTKGALMNIGAAMSRFGATLLGTVFPYIQPFFENIIGWIDTLTEKVEPMAEEFERGLTAFGAAWEAFDGDVTSSGFPGFMERLAFIVRSVFEEGKAALTAFTNAWEYNDGEVTSSGIPGVMERIGYWARQAFDYVQESVIPTLRDFGDWIYENRELLLSLAGGIAATYVAMRTWNTVATVATVVTKGLSAAVAVLTSPVLLTVAAIGALVGALIYAYNNSEEFRRIVDEAFTAISEIVSEVWEGTIRPALEGFRDWLLEEAVPAVTSFWKDTVEPAFQAIGEWIGEVWDNLIYPVFQELREFILESLIPAIEYLWTEVIQPTFTLIAGIIEEVWTRIIWPTLSAIANFIAEDLGPIVLWLWNNVVEPTFGFIGDFIKSTWENMISPVFNFLADFIENGLIPAFEFLWDIVSTVWNDVGDIIDTVWNDWISPAFDAISSGVEAVVDAFDAAVRGVKSAWEWIKTIVAKPIVAVLNFVNDGIIGGINKVLGWVGVDGIPKIKIPVELINASRGYHGGKSRVGGGGMMELASGGILPGWSPGKDDYFFHGEKFDLALAGGEAIMRPEWTKAIGAKTVDAMNTVARTRGVEGVREMLGGGGDPYSDKKGGGIFDWIGDLVGGAVDFFGDLLDDPIKAVTNLFMGAVGILEGNPFYDFGVGLIEKIAGWVKDKFLELIGLGDGADASAIPGRVNHNGLPWQTLWAMVKALVPGAVLTSAYRKGAITRSGFPSYHGMRRAIDFVAPSMMSAFLKIRGILPWSELYYSPAGNLQMRGGKPYNTIGTPAWGDHFDHIHAAYAKGGIFTGLYDEGGMIPPGLSLVANKTGKPEPVLTDEQWKAVSEGGGDTYHLYGVPMDHAEEVAGTILYHSRRARRGKYARR